LIEKYSEVLAFYLKIPQAIFSLFNFPKGDHIIISHDGFLPTLIYSWGLYKKNKNARWESIFHMKSPSIWKGWEGEYTNKLQFPKLTVIRYKLEEQIFFWITKRSIKKIITVNPIYKNFLSSIYKEVVVIDNYGGIDKLNQVSYKKSNNKKYDLCFMARFHKQKGVFELIDIVKKLKEQYNEDISLIVMGGGNEKMEKQFVKAIKDSKLEKNIKYLGYISNNKKYDILRQSKIFIFPSYYESFGHVILEAMHCGIPTVAYDLPPFVVFKDNIVKSPVLDNKTMVQNIIKLLEDKTYYSNMVDKGIKFSNEMFQNSDISQYIKI
jgi:glycosyltransferase involved in cell wall biosynthesis